MRRVIAFDCEGARLVGTLDLPVTCFDRLSTNGGTGGNTPSSVRPEPALLIVSGGNEVRAGAHRGMAQLAARLAAEGIPVFRYDRRGVGDSEGENRGYASAAPDLHAAIAAFRDHLPPGTRLVAFGNCDAATLLATESARHTAPPPPFVPSEVEGRIAGDALAPRVSTSLDTNGGKGSGQPAEGFDTTGREGSGHPPPPVPFVPSEVEGPASSVEPASRASTSLGTNRGRSADREHVLDALILANPWTVEDAGPLPPAAAIRAGYAAKLRQPSEWLRLLRGGVDLRKLLTGLRKIAAAPARPGGLAARTHAAIARWGDAATVILAQDDNTARAYAATATGTRPRTITIPTASHSFARAADQQALEAAIREAIRQLP